MLLQGKPGEINSDIIDFRLKGIDDKVYSLNDFKGEKIKSRYHSNGNKHIISNRCKFNL